MSSSYCSYCGLPFIGNGYSPDAEGHYCCYGCYLVERIVASKGESGMAAWLVIRLGVGAFFAMNVMMISIVLYTQSPASLGAPALKAMHWALVVLSTPALAILGGPFILGSIKDFQNRRISTDALVATGSVAAFAVSIANVARGTGHIYFDTATMLPLLITLGRLMEASAKSRTSQAIRGAFDLLPQTAHVLKSGREVDICTDDIAECDLILVRPGERIPCDGEIAVGRCLIEESAFTGEPMPRSCEPGDKIYGGSVNCDGMITVRATSKACDSRLAQIEAIVKRAQQERAPIERLAERAASAFVPGVWLTAICAFVYWGWRQNDIERAAMSAMAVLVVACPCALGLATPMAICIALGKAANAGLLVRSGEVLEKLPRLRRVFFDKTGTLTQNHLKVAKVISDSPDEALAWAASVAKCSEHIASRAIVDEADSRNITLGEVSDFQTHPGLGISGNVTLLGQKRLVTLGSHALLQQTHLFSATFSEPNEPLTTIYAGWQGQTHAAILMQDTIRAESELSIEKLRDMGIKSAVISGDRTQPTLRLACELAISDVFPESSPIDKANIIRKAKETKLGMVAMVGDGINDAPALAEADISIATGGGTDLARQSSDVILMGDDLSRIPWLIDLSRHTYAAIRQNLIWAFGYNLIAIALACLGYIHPLIAASAMVISSLSVIANSMKLMK